MSMNKREETGVISKCGIVVPTLGTRSEYLELCLRSIREAGDAHICVVAPDSVDLSRYLDLGLVDQRVSDPGTGLARAIDAGLRSFPEEIEFINWLGDDDLLRPESLSLTSQYLTSNPQVTMVFGSCDYINSSGEIIWRNRSGQWAVPLLRIGPCLIPQPGSLFRAQSYREIGGLNFNYSWAFDFDLFIRLTKFGSVRFIPHTLANFRWHEGSLSVDGRDGSVGEASQARRSHLPRLVKSISPLWEVPVRVLTKYAGVYVGRRARQRQK